MAKLHFHYSVMNAGKTTQLLQVRHNYVENGGRVLLFTSAVDDRDGVGRISSRMGMSAEAVPLRPDDDLFEAVCVEHRDRPVTAVLIDEVQFLQPGHVWQAARVVDDLGIPVITRRLTRDDLYIADEAFFTGTAAEVTPIREIDNRRIGSGSRGPVTAKLQKAFFDLVAGRNPKYAHWLTLV